MRTGLLASARRELVTPEHGTGQRPKVLLVAYACDPEHGSEGGVGWGRALATAQRFETHVIFAEEEPAIRRWLATTGALPSLHLHHLAPTPLEERLANHGFLTFLGFHLWQRRAYGLARRLHEEQAFDVLHQVNFGTFREPGYLWRLGPPLVWGPIGGVENYPWRFLWRAGLAGALAEGLRNIANVVQFRLDPRVRAAAHRSAAVLTVNSIAHAAFRRIHGVDTVPTIDLGTWHVDVAAPFRSARTGPLRILWVGSFVHRKAFHLLLDALRDLPAGLAYDLRVLGRGPLERRWRRRAAAAKVAVHWMTWVGREEALAQYRWADVLAFTSLRDASGSVLLEALSHGLPVVCLDHQGVTDLVTDGCAIRIPVTTPRRVVAALSAELGALARDRARLDAMSAAAVHRAAAFLWERKIAETAALYHRILGGSAPFARTPAAES